MLNQFCNLSNKKFNSLTALYVNSKELPKYKRKWHCRCDCGNECDVSESSLLNGHTKSCGCARAKSNQNKNKKYNTYDLDSCEYGIGYTLKGQPFYFDKEDYGLIKDICWFYGYNGYIKGNVNNTTINLHRLVMGVIEKPEYVVDHVGHNLYDNRKSQLRICKQHCNAMNVSLRNDNSSGVSGVVFDTSRNKWATQIYVNGKNIHLGRFTDFNDAVNARRNAEDKYFGEYSYHNSLDISERNNNIR